VHQSSDVAPTSPFDCSFTDLPWRNKCFLQDNIIPLHLSPLPPRPTFILPLCCRINWDHRAQAGKSPPQISRVVRASARELALHAVNSQIEILELALSSIVIKRFMDRACEGHAYLSVFGSVERPFLHFKLRDNAHRGTSYSRNFIQIFFPLFFFVFLFFFPFFLFIRIYTLQSKKWRLWKDRESCRARYTVINISGIYTEMNCRRIDKRNDAKYL